MAKKDAKCLLVSLMPRFFIYQKCPSLLICNGERIEVKINHNPKIKGWEQKSDGNLKSYVNGNTRLLIAIGEESE